MAVYSREDIAKQAEAAAAEFARTGVRPTNPFPTYSDAALAWAAAFARFEHLQSAPEDVDGSS